MKTRFVLVALGVPSAIFFLFACGRPSGEVVADTKQQLCGPDEEEVLVWDEDGGDVALLEPAVGEELPTTIDGPDAAAAGDSPVPSPIEEADAGDLRAEPEIFPADKPRPPPKPPKVPTIVCKPKPKAEAAAPRPTHPCNQFPKGSPIPGVFRATMQHRVFQCTDPGGQLMCEGSAQHSPCQGTHTHGVVTLMDGVSRCQAMRCDGALTSRGRCSSASPFACADTAPPGHHVETSGVYSEGVPLF